jgi:hypothetical protein
VIAIGSTLLLASCSARVAASLLARSVGASRLHVAASFGPAQLRYALRIAASHGSLFVLLLLLARSFSDSGNPRVVICAYLCIGIAGLGVAIWVIARRYWERLFRDGNAARARRFALAHTGSWLASLLMLAVAAALIVPVPAAGG